MLYLVPQPKNYQACLESQGFKCAVCRCSLTEIGKGKNKAVADHCHRTGLARAVLCIRCNVGLGWIESDIAEALRGYRDDWEAKHQAMEELDLPA